MGQTTREDVLLCLNLYEQRRDPALRQARDWMSMFTPDSFDDVKAVMTGAAGAEPNRCWRQIMSYWEMIASLMLSDGVTPECRALFVQTTREFVFHFSKIEPFLAEIRAASMPTAYRNLETFSKSLPEYEQLMTYFRAQADRIKAMKAAAAAPAKKAAKKAAPKAAAKKPAPKAKKR